MKRDAAVAPEYSREGAPAVAAQGTREPLPVDGMTLTPTPLARSRDPNTPLSHRDRQVLDAALRALRMDLDVPDGSVRADVREFDQRQELADSAMRSASLRRGGHTPQ